MSKGALIYPTARLVWLAAAGAPLALVIGVAQPSLWLLPLAWLALVLAVAAFDLVVVPAGLVAEVALPRAVNVGEAFALRLAVGTGRARRVEAALTSDARLDPAAGGRVSVVAGAATLTIGTLRRGIALLPSLDLRWQGPLGLIWRQRRQPIDRRIIVTPDVRAVRTDAVSLLTRDARSGLLAQLETGQGGEFDALADYQPGMDRRRIDWKQTARHRSLIAKEYRTERDNNIVLAFDCGRTMCKPIDGLARLDRAVAAGLLTAFVSLKYGDRVSLFGFDSRPRVAGAAQAGPGAFAQLQRLAAMLDYSGEETNYTLALSTLGARLDRRSLILLFTDFVDTTSAELMLGAVGRLLKRHVLLCIVLRDDELEGLAAAAPATPEDVSRAVIAAGLLRERRIVLNRLGRMGVEILETPWREAGPALARRYLETKRRGRL